MILFKFLDSFLIIYRQPFPQYFKGKGHACLPCTSFPFPGPLGLHLELLSDSCLFHPVGWLEGALQESGLQDLGVRESCLKTRATRPPLSMFLTWLCPFSRDDQL